MLNTFALLFESFVVILLDSLFMFFLCLISNIYFRRWRWHYWWGDANHGWALWLWVQKISEHLNCGPLMLCQNRSRNPNPRSIWDHKNNVVFRNPKVDGMKIFASVQLKAWTLTRNKIPKLFSHTLIGVYAWKHVLQVSKNNSISQM